MNPEPFPLPMWVVWACLVVAVVVTAAMTVWAVRESRRLRRLDGQPWSNTKSPPPAVVADEGD